MEEVVLPTVFRVALCGGTHGNELSGVYLVRERLKRKRKVEEEDHIYVVTVMSNPRAVQQCRRYTETDLNRCFTHATLSGPVTDKTPYEIVRSQELNTLLGPKGSPEAMDLVCDLHNTTANMGLCLIAYSDCDWISLHIYRYLQRQMSDIPVRFIHFDLPLNEAYSLDSVGKHGFAIEIGPQAHGVVRSNILSTMQEGVQHMLEWIHLFNSGTQFEGGKVDVYTMVKNVYNALETLTTGHSLSMGCTIDRDFCLLRPNDPVFQTFSGETLKYKGTEPLYPFFINECAYYEKGIALSLARQRSVGIPSIRSEREGEQRKRKSSAEEMEEEEEIKGEMEEEGYQKLIEYGEESDSLNGQYN
uniref:Aminoacylase 3 n=1 Tax=Salmo trutta TaxID=8032 RepID=A0A673ZWD6_SALTR